MRAPVMRKRSAPIFKVDDNLYDPTRVSSTVLTKDPSLLADEDESQSPCHHHPLWPHHICSTYLLLSDTIFICWQQEISLFRRRGPASHIHLSSAHLMSSSSQRVATKHFSREHYRINHNETSGLSRVELDVMLFGQTMAFTNVI